MRGMCDSSLTLLHLSSPTYNKEGSVSLACSHFSSLFTWIVCFAIFDNSIYEISVRDAFDYLF